VIKPADLSTGAGGAVAGLCLAFAPAMAHAETGETAAMGETGESAPPEQAGSIVPLALQTEGPAEPAVSVIVTSISAQSTSGASEAQEIAASTDPAASGGASDLAQQLANPVASLIQVPVQTNFDFGIGPDDGMRMTTNIQPVIPVPVNDDWNVISRTIVPVIYQEDITAPDSSQFGLGDTVQSFFFSPKELGDSGIIWGAGPVVLVPTGTSAALSSKKWGVGPTGVVLKQAGPWSIGMLVNQIWSIAGDDNRPDASLGFAQPFVSYVTKDMVTYSSSLDVTYDWINDSASIPLNVGISKLIPGKVPISVGGGARYYIETPAGGPDWGLRVSVSLLFPQ